MNLQKGKKAIRPPCGQNRRPGGFYSGISLWRDFSGIRFDNNNNYDFDSMTMIMNGNDNR